MEIVSAKEFRANQTAVLSKALRWEGKAKGYSVNELLDEL